MERKPNSEYEPLLTQALHQFHSLKIREAYFSFRRYFDRLPVEVMPGHIQHISLFGIVMKELGRDRELQFYVDALEKHFQKRPNGEIAYALASLYSKLNPPGVPKTLAALDTAIRNSTSPSTRFKAYIFLSDQYARIDQCALADSIIDQMKVPVDPYSQKLATVWRAVVCGHRAQFEDSDRICHDLLPRLSVTSDWYLYFHTKLVLARTQFTQGNHDNARKITNDLSEQFPSRQFKALHRELKEAFE